MNLWYILLSCFLLFLLIFNPIWAHKVFSQSPMLYCLGGVCPTRSFTVCPHGVGTCGDNPNPQSKGNMHPLHMQRQVTAFIYNAEDQLIATKEAVARYNAGAGNFQGSFDMGDIANGSYLVKLSMAGYLQKQLPGIFQIDSKQITPLSSVSLVAGDINTDDQIDIQDYNMLISCFGSKMHTASCIAPPTTAFFGADINDDGVVDGVDYNLFMRELSVQKGEGNSPTPTPSTILTPTPTMMAGMCMPGSSSSNLISVADLKYVPHGEPTDNYTLVASVSGQKYTFNGTVPGPALVVHQGDHVHVNVINQLPVGLSVHWHGLAVPNSSDGVPGATQNAIKPGQSYTYDFIANEAGSFFYHTHQDTLNDMPKGLYGGLIILPPKENFATNLDYTVFYQNITASDPASSITYPAAPGQTVRVRIVDARNGDFSGAPVTAALIGAPFKVVAIDGREINAPQTISDEIIPIDMAQRYDLEFTMPPSGSVQLVESTQDQAGDSQTWTFGSGPVNNQPASINLLPTFDYTNYGLPAPDDALPPNGTFDQDFTMNIGENLSINGQLFPNVPDLVVHQGNYVHVKMVNNSNMWHAMHLHGGYFTVMNLNGIPVTGSPIHMDTILLAPFQTADIAFHATDPGVWMFHCHILPHAAGGLMMMVRYDNVCTPYSMAPNSGNIPE